MAAINWKQQLFLETLPVTGSCSVKYLQNFNFHDCFGCWNVLPEWNTSLNYHISNFLIQEQTSLYHCAAKQSTGCPEEAGMSPAYCPILLPQREKAVNGLFLHCRNKDVKRNVILLPSHPPKPKKEQMADHAGSSKDAIPNIFDTKTFFCAHLWDL